MVAALIGCKSPGNVVAHNPAPLKVDIIYTDSSFTRILGWRYWDGDWRYNNADSLIEKLFQMWQRDKCKHLQKK